jgi:hypothetical protein
MRRKKGEKYEEEHTDREVECGRGEYETREIEQEEL